MPLIKEINQLNDSKAIKEGASAADIERFKKIWHLVERDIEHLNSVFKDGSSTLKLAERLEGDMMLAKSIKKNLDKLNDMIDDFHMSVGSNHDNW